MSSCGYVHTKVSRVIQGLFYYFVTALLICVLGVVIYWQTEEDSAAITPTVSEVKLSKHSRGFFVAFELCNSKHNDFILLRRYKHIENGVLFNTPDGIYRANFLGCSTTQLQAYAGSLEPGVYEYTVFVRYNVNFLRTIEKQVATVRVTIE